MRVKKSSKIRRVVRCENGSSSRGLQCTLQASYTDKNGEQRRGAITGAHGARSDQ
jgi:hypothetical protein